MTALRILMGAAFVFLVSSALGRLLFHALGLKIRSYERLFLGFVTGAAVFSNLVYLLAVTQTFHTWSLVALGTIIVAVWSFVRPGRGKIAVDPPEPDLPRVWKMGFLMIYGIFATVYVLAAMSPEISPDGAGYHLGLVSRYYDHRGFVALKTNMYSGLAEGIEMLFLAAFAIGRHSAAALAQLLFLLTLPFGMIACGRRAGKPEAGVVGALLMFVAPVVAKDATCAYVDVAAAAIVFGAFCMLEVWREEGQTAALVGLGVLAGFSYACKLTAATAPVFAVLAVVAISLSRLARRGTILRHSALVTGVALVFILPWTIRDLVVFGNPFFPFLNSLFPTPYEHPIVETQLRQILGRMSGVEFWQIPYQLTMGGKLVGIVGPVFLLAPIALLSMRTRFGRYLLLGFVALSLTYFSNIGGRFIIPALPFLSLAMALGLLSLPRIGRSAAMAVVLLHCLFSWPAFIGRWSPNYQWRIDMPDLRAALRIVPEKQYLSDTWPDYQAGLMLDRFVPAGQLVYSPDMGQFAYHHRDLIGNFDSSLGRTVFLTFSLPVMPEIANTWKRELVVSPIRTDRIRIVAGNGRDVDLRVNELRFFDGDAEIQRGPQWQLSASADPWEIQRTFDSDPISWWSSGRYTKPGEWMEVEFGRQVQITRIQIEQGIDYQGTQMHPSTWDQASKTWRDLPFHESGLEVPADRDLRMMVRDELKHLGIRWILIGDWNPAALSLRKDSPYWGITEIANYKGYRLWRLD